MGSRFARVLCTCFAKNTRRLSWSSWNLFCDGKQYQHMRSLCSCTGDCYLKIVLNLFHSVDTDHPVRFWHSIDWINEFTSLKSRWCLFKSAILVSAAFSRLENFSGSWIDNRNTVLQLCSWLFRLIIDISLALWSQSSASHAWSSKDLNFQMQLRLQEDSYTNNTA